MTEKIPAVLNQKIAHQVNFLLRHKVKDEDIQRKYATSYGKYMEAIMDCNGTATDHYIDKEAYKRVAAMRGIKV